MSDNAIGPGGTPDDQASGDDKGRQKVAYETFMKALDEKKYAQSQLAQTQEKLDAFEKAKKDGDEMKLKEQGEWKQMVELREKELDELKKRNAALESSNVEVKGDLEDTWKMQAFYSELPGKIKNKSYLGFVDLKSIVVDPETREIDPTSVKSAVSSFMENYPELVNTKQFKAPPGDRPPGSRKLSHEEWQKLPLKERRERMGDLPD